MQSGHRDEGRPLRRPLPVPPAGGEQACEAGGEEDPGEGLNDGVGMALVESTLYAFVEALVSSLPRSPGMPGCLRQLHHGLTLADVVTDTVLDAAYGLALSAEARLAPRR
jgi:hypothetical protein